MDPRFDMLQEYQEQLENYAEEAEHYTGIDRREFVFMSLVAAAASTFGVTTAARAQGRGGNAAAQQTPPPIIPLGETISWSFMVYPGGTGALMEKLIRERGAKAFERTPFTVEKWSGTVPTTEEDIVFQPAHRLSALIRERKITPSKLTDVYLTRLKRLDPTLLCAVTIMEEQARAEAARADAEIAAGKYRGALHGIPYGVKDLFSTKGVRTTWGAEQFQNQVIDEDAEVVVRLRDAGAILIAKLATGRFANNDVWFRGRTNNPWDIRRGSSGSSAGPSSATAAGCVAFGIGTETSGSIVSPSRECGLSSLRPTYGRVSRHGGMVLGWSRDRVGPICRTIEDAAMVFNTIHGVDEKDTSTITAPFHFDRNIKLASLRIGVDANAPADFVAKLKELGANPIPIGPRPQPGPGGGGGGGGESTAFFDYFVQLKARELGIDVAKVEEVAARGGRGGGRGGRGRGGAPADSAAARDSTPPVPVPPELANIVGLPGQNGRDGRALDFIQSQRRRHMHLVEMKKFLEPYDLYVPNAGGWDVALHSSTGHPCCVLPYRFEPRVGTAPGGGGGGGGGRGGGRGGAGDSTAAGRGNAAQPPQPQTFNEMPTCAVIAGNLFNDDLILSVAHQFQINTDYHKRRPKI